MLLLDVLGKIPAPKTLRFVGIPAFVLFVALLISFYATNPILVGAVTLGIAAGVLATLALDSVRIPGYLIGWMPMDLPMRFGMMILGLDTKLKLRVMSGVMSRVSEEMKNGVPANKLMNEAGFPKLPMRTMRQLLRPAFKETVQEAGVTSRRVRLSGYAWHYTNGASFGVIHALLFGSNWLFTIAFGFALAATFLLILRFMIPPMRPGRRMPTVILLAHVGVILVLGAMFQTYLSRQASEFSLLSQLARLLGV
jgi:hypothetical protein